MNQDKIILSRNETVEILNELQLNAGSLSTLAATYENLRAGFEGSGECPRYIDSVALGAIQRGIIALSGVVDRSVFELDSIVRQADRLSSGAVSE